MTDCSSSAQCPPCCQPAVNGTAIEGNWSFHDATPTCAKEVPDAQTLFASMPIAGYVAFSFLIVFTLITLAIYVEEIYFIVRQFRNEYRQKKTLWILAMYPVYSCCALLGASVPRAGPLVDMIASVFFGTCLYNFSGLMMNYLGGRANAKRTIADGRPMKLNTPPCCCCCVCLPQVKFRPAVLARITFFVMQIVVVRPVTMFAGAILFVNGKFDYGTLTPYPMYPLIAIVNAISMFIALYGLMLFQRVFRSELEQRHLIVGKIMSIQLIMVISSIPNVIVTLLVAFRVIGCTPWLPAPTRGDELCQIIIVIATMPLSIVARVFFRRSTDANVTEKDARPTCTDVMLQQQQQQQMMLMQTTENFQQEELIITKKSTQPPADDNDNDAGDDEEEEEEEEEEEADNRDEVADLGLHRMSLCDQHGDGLDCSWWHQSPV